MAVHYIITLKIWLAHSRHTCNLFLHCPISSIHHSKIISGILYMFFSKLGKANKQPNVSLPSASGQIKIRKVKVPIGQSEPVRPPLSQSNARKRNSRCEDEPVYGRKSRESDSPSSMSSSPSRPRKKRTPDLAKFNRVVSPDTDYDSTWEADFNQRLTPSTTTPFTDNREWYLGYTDTAEIIHSKDIMHHAEYKPCQYISSPFPSLILTFCRLCK